MFDTPGCVLMKGAITMPTINQLVKKNRSKKTRKSKSPVLNVGYNTLEKKQTNAM